VVTAIAGFEQRISVALSSPEKAQMVEIDAFPFMAMIG
jgi:hypothetical protein